MHTTDIIAKQYIRRAGLAVADNVVHAMPYTQATCGALHDWLGLPHSTGECAYAFESGIGCELALPGNELRVRPHDIVARNLHTGRIGVYRDDNFEFLYTPFDDWSFQPTAARANAS